MPRPKPTYTGPMAEGIFNTRPQPYVVHPAWIQMFRPGPALVLGFLMNRRDRLRAMGKFHDETFAVTWREITEHLKMGKSTFRKHCELLHEAGFIKVLPGDQFEMRRYRVNMAMVRKKTKEVADEWSI